MTISILFENLSGYTEGEVDFEEDLSSLEFSESTNFFIWSNLPVQIVDFAKKGKGKQKSCQKGYPCGGSCISKAFDCRKMLKGQAKNFAEFVNLQAAKKASSSKKSKPTKSKKTTPKKATKPKTSKSQDSATKQEQNWRKQAEAKRTKSELDAFDDRSKDFLEVPAGTYKNNGKTIKVSESDGGIQNLKIDGVGELHTRQLTESEVEGAIEHFTSPMRGTKAELGEAYEIRNRPPIKSKEEFEKEFDEAFEKLDPDGTGLVEVNKVRRALGDRLTRKEFDDYFYDGSIDKYTPTGGSLGNYGNSAKDPDYAAALRDSFVTELNGLRTYVQKN